MKKRNKISTVKFEPELLIARNLSGNISCRNMRDYNCCTCYSYKTCTIIESLERLFDGHIYHIVSISSKESPEDFLSDEETHGLLSHLGFNASGILDHWVSSCPKEYRHIDTSFYCQRMKAA